MPIQLLPEEDVLEDPDDDDEADPTLPGDLWFRLGRSTLRRVLDREIAQDPVVYSRSFAL